jgi:HAE1 family hydrophobic/amphiphilic exporter-1
LQGLGSIGALWLRGLAWSPPVLWGMVVLAGIVLSNSILIVDKIVHLRARGIERRTAIIAASALRLRPVLMTALAVGAAMFPIAISPPPATEQFRNIATGISGGLITSTLMTLVVIPVAYMLMDDLIAVIKRIYLVDQPTAAERDKAMALMESGSKEPPSPAQGVEQPVSPEQEVGQELVEGGGGAHRAAE